MTSTEVDTLPALGHLPTSPPSSLRRRREVDIEALWRLAERIDGVGEFVPAEFRGRPDAILSCLISGAELGLGPMQSLRNIHVIKGRPTLSAEAMRALVLAAGHEIEILERDEQHCVVRGRRRGHEAWGLPVTWTLDKARRAHLTNGQAWGQYPEAMLVARATTQLCREMFADVIGGLDVAEELADEQTAAPAAVRQLDATSAPAALDVPSAPTTHVTAPETGRGAPSPSGEQPAHPHESAASTPEPPPSSGDVPAPGDAATVSDTAATGAGEVDDRPPAEPDPLLSADEAKANRALHARVGEVFSGESRETLDQYRHALVALVTRSRPDGPVQSSTELTLEERMAFSARLNEIASRSIHVGMTTDGLVVLRAGRWVYEIDVSVEPPTVDSHRDEQ